MNLNIKIAGVEFGDRWDLDWRLSKMTGPMLFHQYFVKSQLFLSDSTRTQIIRVHYTRSVFTDVTML